MPGPGVEDSSPELLGLPLIVNAGCFDLRPESLKKKVSVTNTKHYFASYVPGPGASLVAIWVDVRPDIVNAGECFIC